MSEFEVKLLEELANIRFLMKSSNKKLEALLEALQPHNEYEERKEEPSVKKPKKSKSTKKLEAGAHRISTTKCTTCGGFISWDMRPERNLPLHVDENGHIKGTGDCPEWEGD